MPLLMIWEQNPCVMYQQTGDFQAFYFLEFIKCTYSYNLLCIEL